jgi:hypothetical protein
MPFLSERELRHCNYRSADYRGITTVGSMFLLMCTATLVTNCKTSGHKSGSITSKVAAVDTTANPCQQPIVSGDIEAEKIAKSLYVNGEVHSISIDMNVADWETLRNQEPPKTCTIDPTFSYSKFKGSLILDGLLIGAVKLKKKSICGSLSKVKPGLKIEKDKSDGRSSLFTDRAFEIEAAESLVLNNVVQDKSYIRQCFGYQTMRGLGYPAPRCNFTKVCVNNTYVGLYVNVEPLDENFVRHAFPGSEGKGIMAEGDWTGNMTGRHADFYSDAESATVFDVKFPDQSELRKNFSTSVYKNFTQALDKDPKQLTDADVSAIAAFVDLKKFRQYYLMEHLLAHGDGATSNRNNYYIYFSPATQLWQFIPYGMDQILKWPPTTAYTTHRLAKTFANSPKLNVGLAADYARLVADFSAKKSMDNIRLMAEKIRPLLSTDDQLKMDGNLPYMIDAMEKMTSISPSVLFP